MNEVEINGKDVAEIIAEQRNAALDGLAQEKAAVRSLLRRIAELEAQLKAKSE